MDPTQSSHTGFETSFCKQGYLSGMPAEECPRRNAHGVPDLQQVLGDARVGDEWVSLIGTQHPLPRAVKTVDSGVSKQD